MKSKNMFLKCPKCGAEQDLTGSDIGRLEMMPLPLHVRSLCMEKSLSGESHDSMVAAESWSDPDICPISEQLVYVTGSKFNWNRRGILTDLLTAMFQSPNKSAGG
jgi:hypothetical protein